MNKNDQWFEPGDKVMRVRLTSGLPHAVTSKDSLLVEFGKVYCVERCWLFKYGYNVVTFVGLPHVYNPSGSPKGWVASNFRRVEEIQLCVNAAKKTQQPELIPA